ncbi:MAG: redoxin domain-containing protein [Planctomycetaceae bacterium]|uniref:Thiol-disulfide oxidoreductase n=1 Tax=Lacipirellula limnantheis TaxID=2528024 RepID=A0A517U543_9BACT|nr:TlpA disulfide reductase family protein [Lacipirellula limnantheis]MBL9162067.1 redoxin domain-containing protein [Planctomycetaceae bacterium]QDT75761.1 thiol-disulfide oxidoreductase [Lacipirellula limnantheis]
MPSRTLGRSSLLAAGLLSLASTVQAAAPTAEDALKLAPVQPGIEYDIPPAADAKNCKINPEKIGKVTAWVVRDPNGVILRQFSDSNGDNVVDTWSYYKNGLEVYRDGDLNFNGKADQYRWFHTGGARWGIDKNEDGKLDAWKQISPEEASEEVIAALRTKDATRFARLLLTADDVNKLGLSKELNDKLTARIAEAPKTFAKLAGEGKIDAKAEFADFGGLRPGSVPAGTRGSTKDLTVYEDVWAMVLAGEQPQQVQIGSMVNVDGSWKLIDGPALGGGNAALAGFFYDSAGAQPQPQPGQEQLAGNEPTEEMQKLIEAIQKVDDELASAAEDKKPALNTQRADLLEQLAGIAKEPAEREQWLQQMSDMISFAVQDGSYPDGIERLEKLEAKLAEEKASDDLRTHVEFRRMQAAWGKAIAEPKADYAKIQEAWLKQLEEFVDKHKTGDHVAEALLQLSMASEFNSDNEAAEKWYRRLVTDFAKSPNAAKAQGAIQRLTSTGKKIPLKGTALQGGEVDLAQYGGKVVLIHYWSSSSPTAKTDAETIADLFKKYGGAKFDVIGVNLDYSKDEVTKFLAENQNVRWKQLFEPGGFESRLANEMGIITLPMTILVDDKGDVVNTNLQITELEDEIKKLMESRVANAAPAK